MENQTVNRGNFENDPLSLDKIDNTNARVKLTRREWQCLEMAAEDKTTKEIARELLISSYTVREYRSTILAKLKCRTMIGAYKKYLVLNHKIN